MYERRRRRRNRRRRRRRRIRIRRRRKIRRLRVYRCRGVRVVGLSHGTNPLCKYISLHLPLSTQVIAGVIIKRFGHLA